MPLGSTTFWAYVASVEKTNLLLDPSFEIGTKGWGTVNNATNGSTSQYQQFGAWSLSITPQLPSTGSAGAFTTWTAGAGTDYTVSAYVRAEGYPYLIGVGDSNGANLVGSTAFNGGTTWQRYSYTYHETSNTTRSVVIRQNQAAGVVAFYVDGVQVEVGSLTTYLDGDQDGCIWLGAPHQSTSRRSGQSRAGGSVIALADIGLKPDDHLGIGMPPVEITGQSFALQPGAEFQRVRAMERTFSLTFKPISGTTMQDYHVVRQRIIDAFKIDATDPQQPTRFWYTGGQGTTVIDAVYAGGLDLGEMEGPMAERGAVRFVAHQPYWQADHDEGTSLAPRVNLGSTNFMVRRDGVTGLWGTLGANGGTINSIVHAITTGRDGNVIFGGQFGSVAGTVARGIAMYFPNSNTFGTLLGGTLGNVAPSVRALLFNPAGSLFVAGDFTTAKATVGAVNIAQYVNDAWGTVGNNAGTVEQSRVNRLAMNRGGTLFLVGQFTTLGGTRAVSAGMLMPTGSWGTMGAGSLSNEARALAIGLNERVYVGGDITKANGTNINQIAQWNGSWGSVGGGIFGASSTAVYDMSVAPNGLLYVGGQYGSAGVAPATNIVSWNGVAYSALGSGVGGTLNQVLRAQALSDGRVFVMGNYTSAGGLPLPDHAAFWTGYNWLPVDIDLPGVGSVLAVHLAPDNSLYLGGNFSGTSNAASVAAVVNRGRAEVYPLLVMKNTSNTGTARVWELQNNTTGDLVSFDTIALPGETLTLSLGPGLRSFTSDYRGNIFGEIIPGSNLTSWRLLPGLNYVGFLADSDAMLVSLYWRPRFWDAAGTIY